MHLAGIVPIAGIEFDFNFDWHDCLMPIEKGYTAIERAVYECAMAGCNTIWIIANNDMQPLLKNRIGEWIYDPVSYGRSYDRYPSESRNEIPIYYVAIHPKDRNRRDCLGWSVLYGAYTAYTVAYNLSTWAKPHKYYCAFPYGVYDPNIVRKYRTEISNPDKNIFISYDGKNIKDNMYLGFTFNGDDFKNCRNHLNKETTRQFYPPDDGEKYPNKKLPTEDRWSARFFDLAEVFKKLSTKKSEIISLSWYHAIDSWDSYKRYLASDDKFVLPSEAFKKPRNRNKTNGEF
jgi:hypothetical protein